MFPQLVREASSALADARQRQMEEHATRMHYLPELTLFERGCESKPRVSKVPLGFGLVCTCEFAYRRDEVFARNLRIVEVNCDSFCIAKIQVVFSKFVPNKYRVQT